MFIHLVAVSSAMFSASERITNGERMLVEPGSKDPILFDGAKASRPGPHLGPKEPHDVAVDPSINRVPDTVTRQEGVKVAQLWECRFFEMSSQGPQDLERLLQEHVRGIREAPRIAKSKQKGPGGEVCRRNRWERGARRGDGKCTVM